MAENWKVREFLKIQIPLLLIVFISMFCGDFTRNFYDEYSKYARYAAQKANRGAGDGNGASSGSADDIGADGVESDVPPAPPSMFALRLFSLLEKPSDMGKVRFYAESSTKPRPLVLAFLGVQWDDGKPVAVELPSGPVETPEEIIQRLRRKEAESRGPVEDSSIREYLDKLKSGQHNDHNAHIEPNKPNKPNKHNEHNDVKPKTTDQSGAEPLPGQDSGGQE